MSDEQEGQPQPVDKTSHDGGCHVARGNVHQVAGRDYRAPAKEETAEEEHDDPSFEWHLRTIATLQGDHKKGG